MVYMGANARATRIHKLLENLTSTKIGDITYEDMIAILKDTKDLIVESTKPVMCEIVKSFTTDKTKTPKEVDSQVLSILDRLEKWNSNFDKELEEPTYFSAWMYYIARNLMGNTIADQEIRTRIFMSKLIVSNSSIDIHFRLKAFKDMKEDKRLAEIYCKEYSGTKIHT